MDEKIFHNDDFLEPTNAEEKKLDQTTIDMFIKESQKVMYEIRAVQDELEQLTEDPASYVKEICRLARIDPAEGLRQFTAGPVRNARPTNTNKAVPDTWRAWTTERYGPGNLQLANKFGLTLERWGYAV